MYVFYAYLLTRVTFKSVIKLRLNFNLIIKLINTKSSVYLMMNVLKLKHGMVQFKYILERVFLD